MKNFSTINDMDGVLMDVMNDAEKAVYMAYQLYDELSTDETDAVKLYYYDQLQIMANIAHDYTYRVQEELKKVRELFDTLWQDTGKANDKLEAQEAGRHGKD